MFSSCSPIIIIYWQYHPLCGDIDLLSVLLCPGCNSEQDKHTCSLFTLGTYTSILPINSAQTRNASSRNYWLYSVPKCIWVIKSMGYQIFQVLEIKNRYTHRSPSRKPSEMHQDGLSGATCMLGRDKWPGCSKERVRYKVQAMMGLPKHPVWGIQEDEETTQTMNLRTLSLEKSFHFFSDCA